MRNTVRRALLLGFAAAIGASGLLLSACLEDFTVQPPDAGASPGFDARPPVGNEAGPTTPEAGTDAGMDAGVEGGPKTYCDSVVPPASAAQFLCADFDSPQLEKGWDALTVMNNGVGERTMNVSVSPPFAFTAAARGAGSVGALAWRKNGAAPFTEATAVFHVNPTVLAGNLPPSPGLLELLEIATSGTAVTFGYSRGSTEFEPTGLGYVGYYVMAKSVNGTAGTLRFKIANATLAPNVWTVVKLQWASSGKVNLFYDNMNVFGDIAFNSVDTSVSFRLGAHANGDTVVMPPHRFDNVELSIRR